MRILVTGGAGFIGSNLVEALIKDNRVSVVRVLDNLSTGHRHNIEEFMSHPKFEFMEGDIRNYDTCLVACQQIDLISHQAALGSVPRSIKEPLITNEINITGTLNVFTASKSMHIKRIVFAASSSTYGDDDSVKKVENQIGKPLSPYAVTKYVNELYARVYANLYGIEYIGLRYFNVFGPKQDPNGAYAAVIPIFMKAAIDGNSPTINGDGKFSRDFTFIANVVQSNLLALFAPSNIRSGPNPGINEIYNIAYGERTSLNELWELIQKVANKAIPVIHGPQRVGDIPHSLADISKAINLLDYAPTHNVKQGLEEAYDWYIANLIERTKS